MKCYFYAPSAQPKNLRVTIKPVRVKGEVQGNSPKAQSMTKNNSKNYC